MSAFSELSRFYEDRRLAARAAAAAGRKVVALAGTTVPVELVLAARAFAVNVAPLTTGATPHADRYLERHFDAEVRSILESILAGEWDWIDLLVLSRPSDGHLELYYALKELVRLGEGALAPPLHLFDMLHGQSAANHAYGLARTRELVSRLAAATGTAPEGDRLREAIRSVNRQRAAIRRLQGARAEGRLSGCDAMVAIGAGRFMDPSEHAGLLDAYLGELGPARRAAERVLLVAAEPLTDLRVHRAVEASGAVVVAEDDAWGARAAGADVDAAADDPLAAVFDSYFTDVPSPRLAPHQARDAWFDARLEAGGIDAVAFYIPRSDHWFGWDYPRLRDRARSAGVRSRLLRDLGSEVAV